MHTYTNKLISETSPYLLQHAHNPVDWYPWGEEALQKAKEEDKPILVSIGYAACHWCHVMERESFENPETARLMNQEFVNIKIDREERPDLDHIYMDAVQAISGSGGWPLNVFLTPDRKPYYGGTYFPPAAAFNRASWPDVLQQMAAAYRERRQEVEEQAENLTKHLEKANSFGVNMGGDGKSEVSRAQIDDAARNLLKSADTEWGGFGKAPKFPQTFSVQFLLRYHHHYGKRRGAEGLSREAMNEADVNAEALSREAMKKTDERPSTRTETAVKGSDLSREALTQALLSLDKMIEGGIYDQIGGGFSRYSTDTEWLAPHFEKMLYDNALLMSVLSEAYQATGVRRYREVIGETMDFIEREMLDKSGGFYSALDADSEGEEGKFYVWTVEEVREVLGQDAEAFCMYYDVTEKGNWSEPHSSGIKNILRVKKSAENVAARLNITEEILRDILTRGRVALLNQRASRVRPALDDKIILGWNALMNTACSKAFAATGEERYRKAAVDNMHFLLRSFRTGVGDALHHTFKEGEARYPAFLDDYAFTIEALIHLQEITGDQDWLEDAGKLTEHVLNNYSEEGGVYFYFTPEGQQDVIMRKKEVYDGAVPSGNSTMAMNLHRLGILMDRMEWRQRALEMVDALKVAVVKYPVSFGVWINLMMELERGTLELALVGADVEEIHAQVLREFIPNRVLMMSREGSEKYPLLAGKQATRPASMYLCKDFSCRQPVNSFSSFITLIDSVDSRN